MTKVLACKVEDELYFLFDRLPGTKSKNLRRAIIMLLNYEHSKPVNSVYSIENRKKHEDIVRYLDSLDFDSKLENGGF